jgi:hypothetical protein
MAVCLGMRRLWIRSRAFAFRKGLLGPASVGTGSVVRLPWGRLLWGVFRAVLFGVVVVAGSEGADAMSSVSGP